MLLRLLVVVAMLLAPGAAWAAWTYENAAVCDGLAASGNLTCLNIFTADGAQNTPVLISRRCANFTVDLHLSGGATATGFIQSCSNTTPTVCTDLHTTALNGTTVLGYNNSGPEAYIRGRMTAATLGAGAAHLKANCGDPK